MEEKIVLPNRLSKSSKKGNLILKGFVARFRIYATYKVHDVCLNSTLMHTTFKHFQERMIE